MLSYPNQFRPLGGLQPAFFTKVMPQELSPKRKRDTACGRERRRATGMREHFRKWPACAPNQCRHAVPKQMGYEFALVERDEMPVVERLSFSSSVDRKSIGVMLRPHRTGNC
ncbi:hypothetical protein [Burkholderia singularis]|uniref:hypothetical protein n=1 Tax=Burkholderia singularis TaxID=1503053 RepID=UPI001180BC96|nr:hypothetical protein [Burkholderia singularis]